PDLEVPRLAGEVTVPPLDHVRHRDGHLAVLAAEHLLQLAGVGRVGLVRGRLVLHFLPVKEHRETPLRSAACHSRRGHRLPGEGRSNGPLVPAGRRHSAIPPLGDGRVGGGVCQSFSRTRNPSNATATTVSANASAPTPPRGRYHSTRELTMPNNNRAAVAGSTSGRRSPSAAASLTNSETIRSNSRRRASASRSTFVLPRTRSS